MNRAIAHPLLVPAIAASQFAPPFMISGVAVALPALGTDLAAGATALSLVETVFLAASVALLLPAGRLGDACDKATLYKLGMVALALVLLVPIHFMLTGRWRRPPRGAVHLPSTFLAVAAMLALVGGAATLREGAPGYASMVLGLALLAAFVLLQRRVAQPLLEVDLLMRNIVLRSAL